MMRHVDWREVEDLCESEITKSLASIEATEIGGEHHRGRLTAFRLILRLSTRAPEGEERRVQVETTEFVGEDPPV